MTDRCKFRRLENKTCVADVPLFVECLLAKPMRPQEHTKIVFLTDLGTIRAFRISPGRTALSAHQGPCSIEEIKMPTNEWNTDRPSRFPTGRRIEESIPMSPGENHHRKTESENRRLAFLAQQIERVLAAEGMQPWCLAAPPRINNRLLNLISRETREFLATNLRCNLTHIKLHELEERFAQPSSSS